MSSVVISGDTSGAITLSAPAVAGTNTATLPAATGTVMVSGNQPAFSAYLNANQSITSGVYTKITLDTEEFDTNNNFASSRFTPTVAGYYQINAFAYTYPSVGTIGTGVVAIYKNGTVYKSLNSTTASTQSSFGVSSLVYANGTTDYFELYMQNTGTSPTVLNGIQNTFMNGCLVRTA